MAKAVPAPLDAGLVGVPKGDAVPATEFPSAPVEQTPAFAEAASAHQQATRRPVPQVAPLPVEEAKTALTVRLPVSTQERLREAAHRTRREKQAIVDEALLAWLEEYGY